MTIHRNSIATRALRAIARAGGPMTLDDLADELGLPTDTVRKHLHRHQQIGLVIKGYSLTIEGRKALGLDKQ